MKRIRQAKVWIKIQVIRLMDFARGDTFKLAGKSNNDVQFPHYIELLQEIKKSETLENKLYNISLTAQKISEVIIMPGEIFSFWKIVGNPNSILKKSRSIINGEIVNEIGGGICQVSGIIYHLSILAGLEIIQRHNHSIDIYTDETRFTPLGTDATVVYGYKDLRIRNNFTFPIKFQFEVTADIITLKLLSASEIIGRELQYDIQDNGSKKIVTVIDENGKIINTSIYKNLLQKQTYQANKA